MSVSGPKLVILLEPASGVDRHIQVGGLVKVRQDRSVTFGVLEGMSIPMPREAGDDRELQIAEVGLIGELVETAEGAPTFRRGVSTTPALNQAVEWADHHDAATVYSLADRQSITVGHVQQSPDVPANVAVDDMLGKHFAILGTTGTGKSCALTLILKNIITKNPRAHILLLDPHGEYGRAFGDMAEHITVDNFKLPFWLFNFEEVVEVVFGADRAKMANEIGHLRELIISARLSSVKDAKDAPWVNVDTPMPYAFAELMRLVDLAMGKLDANHALPALKSLRTRLSCLQAVQRYNFILSLGLTTRDTLRGVLSRLFRIPTNGKPLAVFDLAGVPSEILNVIVAVVARLAFDLAVSAGQDLPILLICEEAHRYAPQETGSGFEPAKRGLARIAKEGRKYGVSLGVLSQRPSDLASSILSQCNTVFAFRMSSERDQEIIRATLSDGSSALFSALPILGNSEAIAVGEGVSVPMRLCMAQLPAAERPRSSSAAFSMHWQADETATALDVAVGNWRGRAALTT
ncbi:MAG TPA: DUF87 domain-containing protein [Acetobacteraceae bacterium]|nr:DUF87 domain-containing protein [Acetobacteraceae bacterium]